MKLICTIIDGNLRREVPYRLKKEHLYIPSLNKSYVLTFIHQASLAAGKTIRYGDIIVPKQGLVIQLEVRRK